MERCCFGTSPCGYRRYGDVEDILFPIALEDEQHDFCSYLSSVGKGYQEHKFCFKDEYSKFKTVNKIIKLKSLLRALIDGKSILIYQKMLLQNYQI